MSAPGGHSTRLALATLAVVAAVGCATAPAPAPGPAPVLQLEPDRTARCRLLGAVEGSHANAGSVAENELQAIETVRGRAARMGGNAFVVTHRTSSMWRSVVQADVYLCPSWEPVPGLQPG